MAILTTLIAVYGAVLSSIVAAWNISSWVTNLAFLRA